MPSRRLALAGADRQAPVLAVTYLVQFFYPVDLAAFYPYPVGRPAGLESRRRRWLLAGHQRRQRSFGGGDILTWWSAGSGFWEC